MKKIILFYILLMCGLSCKSETQDEREMVKSILIDLKNNNPNAISEKLHSTGFQVWSNRVEMASEIIKNHYHSSVDDIPIFDCGTKRGVHLYQIRLFSGYDSVTQIVKMDVNVYFDTIIKTATNKMSTFYIEVAFNRNGEIVDPDNILDSNMLRHSSYRLW